MFWGTCLKAGSPEKLQLQSSHSSVIHLSKACLEPNKHRRGKTFVQASFNNKNFVLAVLDPHNNLTSDLNLNFYMNQDIALTVKGPGKVYLSGYALKGKSGSLAKGQKRNSIKKEEQWKKTENVLNWWESEEFSQKITVINEENNKEFVKEDEKSQEVKEEDRKIKEEFSFAGRGNESYDSEDIFEVEELCGGSEMYEEVEVVLVEAMEESLVIGEWNKGWKK